MIFLLLKLTVKVLSLSNHFPDGDQMESMDTVSLQAVTLADGSTAYIQHDSKTSFSDGQIMDGQVIQLEDGSAAYVQHVSMPKAGKTQIPAVTLDRDNSIRVKLCCVLKYQQEIMYLYFNCMA